MLDNIILRLLQTPSIGTQTILKLLNSNITEDIFVNPHQFNFLTSTQINNLRVKPKDFDEYIQKHNKILDNTKFVHILSDDYPKALFDLYDPPICLYIKGRLNINKSLAIVGSRNADIQSLNIAFDFAKNLSPYFSIISGLADGIDTKAHMGAIDNTIAVIGTGIDSVYPAKNLKLAHQIIEHGAIISEFLLGTKPHPANFPRRNRIISALSQGVLVIKASQKSGSLITARLANEIGRDIFAIPSNICDISSKGCNELIKQGASLVDCVDDILNFYNIEKHNQHIQQSIIQSSKQINNINTNLSNIQQNILENLSTNPIHLDKLSILTNINIQDMQSELFMLEMEDLVCVLDGGYYILKK